MDSQHESRKHVLCVGAAVLDTLFRVHDMPKGEGKVLPYEMLQIAEGMASSAAYAVHRMGGRASLWGAVGDDETGTRILRDLAESGIDTTGMTVAAGARSALSTIIIDDRGERLIVPFMITGCMRKALLHTSGPRRLRRRAGGCALAGTGARCS